GWSNNLGFPAAFSGFNEHGGQRDETGRRIRRIHSRQFRCARRRRGRRRRTGARLLMLAIVALGLGVIGALAFAWSNADGRLRFGLQWAATAPKSAQRAAAQEEIEPVEREPIQQSVEREPIERVRARLDALAKANAAPRCGARSKRTGKPCRG